VLAVGVGWDGVLSSALDLPGKGISLIEVKLLTRGFRTKKGLIKSPFFVNLRYLR
jgi:hypothetical protein